MIKILLAGCCGKMGQAITSLVSQTENMQIVGGVDVFQGVPCPYPVFSHISDCTVTADVIIDFSRPDSLCELLDYAVERCMPLVISTTGHTQEQRELIQEASEHCPLFFSGNMSVGLNLMLNLLKTSTKILGDSYDIEIVEKHHNQKVDAPSGTALMIADVINATAGGDMVYTYDRHTASQKRGKRELGIHSLRGGTIVGEHTVIFAGQDECFEITHKAQSRQIFAIGALRAASFLLNKGNGLYNMNDVISQDQTVTQVYAQCDDAVITVCNVPMGDCLLDQIFGTLAEAEINVDMISQATPVNGTVSLSFSIPKTDLLLALSLLEKLTDRREISVYDDICKLSAEGIGMEHQSGAASKFLHALSDHGIPVYLITTSETKIACCIPGKDAERAAAVIKQQFNI